MKISKELRERIQRLESEQKRQTEQLTDLNELRDLAAISELEQELSTVSKAVARSKAQLSKPTNIDAKTETASIDEQIKGVKVHQQSGPDVSHNIDLNKEAGLSQENTAQVKGGLAVCLLFNKNSPSEWSDEAGGGWRGKGMGTHYSSNAAASKKLQELKTKWPDYPIEVRKA